MYILLILRLCWGFVAAGGFSPVGATLAVISSFSAAASLVVEHRP